MPEVHRMRQAVHVGQNIARQTLDDFAEWPPLSREGLAETRQELVRRAAGRHRALARPRLVQVPTDELQEQRPRLAAAVELEFVEGDARVAEGLGHGSVKLGGGGKKNQVLEVGWWAPRSKRGEATVHDTG